MKNFGKVLLALLLFFGVLTSVISVNSGALSAFLPEQQERFYDDLSAIYQKYDTDRDSLNPEEPFALRRLLVSEGYQGKRYGSVARAWDKKHDYAVLQYQTKEQAKAALKKMEADGLTAEPDALGALDGAYASMYSFGAEYMGTKQYNDKLTTSPMTQEEIIVAVIDTGVMYDNSYIADRMYSHGKDLSGDECEDAYYEDTEPSGSEYYHGTAVCGVVADHTPDTVKLLPIKVMPFDGASLVASNVAAAINYAVDAGAKVVNLSLYTTGGQSAMQKAVNYALKNNVIVCASAGNGKKVNGVYEPVEIQNRYPTCTDGVIVVGAQDGNVIRNAQNQVIGYEIYDTIAPFSNYGDEVDFAAPGTRVVTCGMSGGVPKRMLYSGTSFSAPCIAACCAMLKTVKPDLSRDDIYQTLLDFSRDFGDAGKDVYFGNGVPKLDNIVYSDGNSYTWRIPEGTLSVTQSADYTAASQPWKRFADRLTNVTVSSDMTEIGDFMFAGMSRAQFTMPQDYLHLGVSAFENCTTLTDMTFPMGVGTIGANALGGIEGLTIHGYRNTSAEDYAINNGIAFDVLGCRHNYVYESFDPTSTQDGYTVYTCTVCGDSYIGEYIPPVTLDSGVCGEHMTYTFYDSGKLTLNGSGDMYDYLNTPAPWDAYKNEITILQINPGVEKISPFAFYGCRSIAKFRLDENNRYYTGDTQSLISVGEKELVLTCVRGDYTLDPSVEQLSATAFFTAGPISFTGNSRFIQENNLIYDPEGNIVAALPGYTGTTLTVEENLTIRQYAFILCDYPAVFDTKRLAVTFEPYSIGYIYNGALTKRDMTFRVCQPSTAYDYADENGFMIDGYDVGRCGDDMIWQYDEKKRALYFIGSGEMYQYASTSDVPWRSRISSATVIQIGNEVTSLSPYAFSDATALRTLTMPLSLPAPDETVWTGCTGITSLTLTLGTGRMDDYVKDGVSLYQYTPWFLSRSKITSFSMDENVKYIGREAFNRCTAITALTLNSVEEIAPDAFLACSKLRNIIIYSKNSVIGDHALQSYKTSTAYGIYQFEILYGYADSTVHDYALRMNSQFVSLGCGHSRNVEELSREPSSCCIDEVTYRCNDCGEEFTEYEELGHTVTLSLRCTNGQPILDAVLTENGKQIAVSDENGTAVGQMICGTHTLSVSVHGIPVATAEITVDQVDISGSLLVQYADFVSDGVINAKDYAFALQRGYDDAALFDWGKVNAQQNGQVIIQ